MKRLLRWILFISVWNDLLYVAGDQTESPVKEWILTTVTRFLPHIGESDTFTITGTVIEPITSSFDFVATKIIAELTQSTQTSSIPSTTVEPTWSTATGNLESSSIPSTTVEPTWSTATRDLESSSIPITTVEPTWSTATENLESSSIPSTTVEPTWSTATGDLESSSIQSTTVEPTWSTATGDLESSSIPSTTVEPTWSTATGDLESSSIPITIAEPTWSTATENLESNSIQSTTVEPTWSTATENLESSSIPSTTVEPTWSTATGDLESSSIQSTTVEPTWSTATGDLESSSIPSTTVEPTWSTATGDLESSSIPITIAEPTWSTATENLEYSSIQSTTVEPTWSTATKDLESSSIPITTVEPTGSTATEDLESSSIPSTTVEPTGSTATEDLESSSIPSPTLEPTWSTSTEDLESNSIPSTTVEPTWSTATEDLGSSSIPSTTVEPTWSTATEDLGSSLSLVDPVFTVTTSNVQPTHEISFSTTISVGVPTSSYLPPATQATPQPVETTTSPDDTFRPAEVQYSLKSSIELTQDETILFRILWRNAIDHTEDISTALRTAYSHIRGFMDLDVTDVRTTESIIEAEYMLDLVLAGEVSVEELLSEVKDRVIPVLQNQTIVPGYTFNTTHFEESINDSSFTENIRDPSCDRLIINCPLGYGCFIQDRLPLCRSLCSEDNKPDCGLNGACALDSQTGKPYCRCFESDEYIFSGETCQETREKFSLSKGSIIGLGVGIGFAVFFVCILIIVFLMLKLQRSREKNNNSGSDPEYLKRKGQKTSGDVELKFYKTRKSPGSFRSVSNKYNLDVLQTGGDYSYEDVEEAMSDYTTFNRSPVQCGMD